MGKIKSILIMTMLFTVLIPLTPHVNADAPNVMGFDESIKHATIGESFTTNIYVDVSSEIDSASVDNLTFIPAGIINYSSTTQGNLFSGQVVWMTPEGNGEINNISGYAKPITWSHSETVNETNKTLATITWQAYRVGITNTKITAGGTAISGGDPGTSKRNGTVYVHPSAPSTFEISSDHPSYNELSWTTPSNLGIDNVVINYDTVHVPVSATDGTEIYNGTGTSYNHTNVPIESDIYYAAWGWNETAGMYSYTAKNTSSESENPLPSTFEAEAVTGDNHSINLSWTSSLSSQTLTLRPNGAGSSTEWTASSGGNWECVDDTVADGDTTNINCMGATSTLTDLFELSDSSNGGNINSITLVGIIKNMVMVGSPPTANLIIYNNSASEYGPISLSSSYESYENTWNQNPWTAVSWSWNDIDNIQGGISSYPAGMTGTYCTQLYLNVSYTPSQTIYIERNTESSWSKGSGTEIYNGTATNYTDSGLASRTRYYYQAWVYDSTDGMFSSTYQSANAITNGPNSPPTITNVSTPTSANTSETITINVSVSDVDGVGSVYLNGGYGSSPYYDDFNESMTNTAGNYYEKDITVLSNTTDTLSYWITANDTSDAWTTSTVHSCTISDHEIPVVTDNTPSTTIVAGGIAFFLVNCTDNVGVSSVKINYTQGSTTDEISLSLKNGSARNGNWNGSLNVLLDNANDISYTINATDSSGNSNTTVTGSITVNDNTSPTIGSVTIIPSSGTMGTNINISCTITDNIAVDTVTFNITKPDATSTNTTISTKTGNIYYDNSTYDQRGTYTVKVYANDTSNNLNNSTAQTFTINNRAPTITNPHPDNQSTTANPHGFTWNVTIADADTGDLLNWSITCSNSESSSGNNEADGSKTLTLTDNNLNYDTNYTIWVNATDGRNSTNNTFWFETRTQYDPELPSSFTATAYNRTIINISWTPGTNATHTYIEYNTASSWTKGTGSGQWNCTNTSYNHTGLTPNMKYYYQAWSYNETDNKWSSTNASANATTDNQNPVIDDPTPTNDSTDQALTVNWSVNISDGDGDTFDWWINSSAGSNSGTGDSDGRYNVTLSDLGFNTSYRVNVSAVDLYGGRNSSWFNFTTRDPYYPSNATDFTATAFNRTVINLTWTWPSQYADRVCINYTEGSTAPTGASGFIYNGTGTSYNLTGLNEDTTYSFSIWSYNTTDNVYSQTYNTTSNTTLANTAPTISGINPSDSATEVDKTQDHVNVTISDVNNEDTLDWNISVYNESSTLVASNNGTGASSGSNISCTLSTPLDYSETFTWNVNVSDGFTWTNESYSFTTRDEYTAELPSTFTATAHNRTVINISWTPGANASHTYIEYLNESEYTASWTRGNGHGQWNCTNTTYNHTGLTPNMKYYYQVWSYNDTDNVWSSDNSSANATTNNQVPTFTSPLPSNNSENQNLTVNWSVQIQDADSDSFDWWINCSAGSDSGTGDSDGRYNVTLSGLEYNTSYRVNVTAVDSYGGSNNSWYNFTTRDYYVPSPPTGFTATVVNRTTINLTWSNAGSNHTIIEYKNESDYSSAWSRGSGTEIYNGTGTSTNDSNHTAGQTVYYQAWSWNQTDGNYSTSNVSTHATTDANNHPSLTGEQPDNSTSDVNITQSSVNVTISDAESDLMSWNISVYNGTSALIASNEGSDAGNGSISCSLSTPLSYNMEYTWQVNVTDSFNWTNATYNFTTRNYYVPSPPTDFTATAFNKTTIILSWTNNGTNYTIIEYKNSSDYTTGWDLGTGTEIYNGTGTSTNDSNHTASQKVYYQAWSWNATDGNYSTSYNSTYNTTLANVAPALQHEHPTNGSENIDITQSYVNVTIIDNDETMDWNITIYNETGDRIGTNNGTDAATNSNISASISETLDWNETITWNVNVSDGYNWTNATYNFTTRDKYYPPAPTDFNGTAYNKTAINLTWTWPTQYADRVCINYTQGDTPPTGASGFDYNNTGTSWNATNLTVDTNYSFTIWGYNTTENVYTRSPVNVTVNTLENYAPQTRNETPTNKTTGVNKTQSTVNITITDANSEDTIDWNISVYNESLGLVASNNGSDAANGSLISCTLTTPLILSHNYTWNVSLSDGCGGNNNTTYWFVVRDAYQPETPSLTATTYNTTQINLSIGTGANTSHVRVEYNTSSTWDRGNGTLVQNNTNATANVTDLHPHTKYYFQAWAYNATDNTWGSVNRTNATTDNTPVNFSDPNPTNQSTNANPHGFNWSINITDADGDTFNWTIVCSNGENNSGTNETDGRKNLTLTDANLSYDTQYTIWVNATDTYNNTNETFVFTTRSQYIPDPPTGFTATTYNHTAINLSWANIDTNKTYIERNYTSSTWTRGTGTMIQNLTTNTTYNDTNLTNGTHYYYRAWSYNETDECYSATSTVTSAITTFENNILIHSPQPADLAKNILTNRSNVSIMINSTIGEQFNYTISGSKIVTIQGINQTNDTFTANISSTLDYGTQYSWTIRANNSNGWANATYVFTTNYKPLLSLSASPSSGNTPLTTMITYTISDSDGSITNANLSFGDGNYLNVTQNATGSINHTYSSSGTYTVTLTATDNQNASNTTTTQIEVTTSGGGTGGGTAIPPPTTPTADAGGPYAGMVNETITFDGSGSSDPDGSIVSYSWDFGDGTTATGVNPTHSYETPDAYTVTLTVTDDDEQTATDTATVTITENIVEVTDEIKQELEALYNISLPDDFYATDTNGDGIVDSFTDPNEILYEIRYTTLEDDEAFLISVNGDLSQLFIWIPGLNQIINPVLYQVGTIASEEQNITANTVTVTVEVNKSNWTYFEVEDTHPTRSVIVQTDDGRKISEDRVWRENGSIYVLDDPSVLYDLIYSAADVDISLSLALSEESVEYGTSIQAMINVENGDDAIFDPGTLICSLSRNNETFWSETIIISDENEVPLNRTIITKGLPFDSYTYTASYTTGTDQTIEATASFTVTEPTVVLPWILIILFNLIIIGMAVFYYLYKQGIIVIER